MVQLSALQAWTAAGAHLAHGPLLSSWSRRARRLLGAGGGGGAGAGAGSRAGLEHARSTLRAEIRRRGRAQLAMQGSLQLLLGELFAPTPAPTETGQGAQDGEVGVGGDEDQDEQGPPPGEARAGAGAGPSGPGTEEPSVAATQGSLASQSMMTSWYYDCHLYYDCGTGQERRGRRALLSVQEAMNEFNMERVRRQQEAVALPPCTDEGGGGGEGEALAAGTASSSLSGPIPREQSRTRVAMKVPKAVLVSKRQAAPGPGPGPAAASSTGLLRYDGEGGAPTLTPTGAAAADRFLTVWRRFASLRARREDVEDALLLSSAQEQSSRRTAGQLLLAALLPPLAPPARRAQWVRERQLVLELRALLRAMRSLQPHRAGPISCSADEPSLSASEVWLRCFDVDCSGSFDENSLGLILRTVRRNIDAAQLLHDFPHLRTPGNLPLPDLT